MIDLFLDEQKLIKLDLPKPDPKETKAIEALNANTNYEWYLTKRIGDFVAFAALEGEEGRARLYKKPKGPTFILRCESFECFTLAMNKTFCREYKKHTFGDPKSFVADSQNGVMKEYFAENCAGPYLLLGRPREAYDHVIPLLLMHKSRLQWVESGTRNVRYEASTQWMMRGSKSDYYTEHHHCSSLLCRASKCRCG